MVGDFLYYSPQHNLAVHRVSLQMDRIHGYRITYVVVFAVLATTTMIVDAVPEYVEASRGVRIRGPEEGAGRVEVLVNGQWGTVCDVDFDLADANVVCRQLGFRSAIEAIRGPWFGPGVGPIWMSRVACRGNEPRFSACSHARRHRCSHQNDVGVTCRDRVSNPDELEWDERRDFGVRLRGETAPHFGYVEVLAANGRWGRVCPDGWGTKDARVVCGQLGYRKGKAGVYKSWNKSSKTPRNGTFTGSMTSKSFGFLGGGVHHAFVVVFRCPVQRIGVESSLVPASRVR